MSEIERRAWELRALVDVYWNLAFAEGQEGRTHDTEAGDAQRVSQQIDAAIAALSAAQDDSELDGTDGAHPAWWRGADEGTYGACAVIERALDGLDDGSGVICSARLEVVRRRVLALSAGPQVPKGWVLVPEKITDEMTIAFAETWFSKPRPIDDVEMDDCYEALLAAGFVTTDEYLEEV